MKSRFSLLLAVALFVAPAMIIAEDAVVTETTTTEVTTPVITETTTPEVTAPVTTETAATEVKTEVTEVKEEAKEELSTEAKAGILAAVTAFIAARRENVNSGLDKVAKYSFNPVLTKLASFDCLKGGKFESNIPTMNRIFVSATVAAFAFAAYKAYVAQQDASEDFDADFDVDNN